jgi:nucleoside-diphosphate-sugar epimerase
MKKVLITGAAGNLGSLLASYLIRSELQLNLMIHKKNLNPAISNAPNVKVYKADLNKPETLDAALERVDTVVHFAGVLFRHHPEKFLHRTNTGYFRTLLDKSIQHKVKRVILISFPHVEGETTPENPAKGLLTAEPESVHARTRLEEEKMLFEAGDRSAIEAVSLRLGMVYSRGILMIEGARRFARYHMLGIWKKPTWIHLISTIDYLEATRQAILKKNIKGIYHLGDEGVQTLQEFLDDACEHWGLSKPRRMSTGLIMFAARMFELRSMLFGRKSPLTRDFIRIGMASYYGDTSRMRKELLPKLRFKNYHEGIETL